MPVTTTRLRAANPGTAGRDKCLGPVHHAVSTSHRRAARAATRLRPRSRRRDDTMCTAGLAHRPLAPSARPGAGENCRSSPMHFSGCNLHNSSSTARRGGSLWEVIVAGCGMWAAYVRQLQRWPLATKSLTSGVLFGAGDVISQVRVPAPQIDERGREHRPASVQARACMCVRLCVMLLLRTARVAAHRLLHTTRVCRLRATAAEG